MSHHQHSLKKSRGALFSIASNSLLVVIKLGVGLLTGSVAIISEAIHSALDLLASIMAFVAIKIADKPADDGHPFGHGKAENLAALFEGLLIVGAGAAIVYQAIKALAAPEAMPSLGWGILVMFISAAANLVISSYLLKVGKETRSDALVADAWHLRTDVYTSLGVFVALGAIAIGKVFWPTVNLNVLDPVCAMVVAFLILKAGASLSWEAATNLIDQSLSPEEIKLIEEHIAELAPGIKGFSGLRTRRSGPLRFVSVELEVDGNLTVHEAHALGDQVVEAIKVHFPEAEITFHLEPR